MKISKYTYLAGLVLASLATSCEEQDDIMTQVEYDRLFAPIGIEARVINKTDVRLSWKEAVGVTGYNIEIFADDSLTYTGTPVRTMTIGADQNPYTVEALEGETKYSARLQAICDNANKASKWNGVYFKTDAEQLFRPLAEGDVTATSVTLTWTAGRKATRITLQPGNIVHQVTSDEIAAGKAVIEGLTPETAYEAVMKNGDKTVGHISFETLLDLGGAVEVKPEFDWLTMIAEAEPGTAFAFHPGNYQASVGDDGVVGKVVLDKDVEFKAVRPFDRPVINACFQLKGGAAVSMKQIVLDGTGTDGSQAFDYKEAVEFKGLILEDCEIMNYGKGVYYVNVAATIDEITFNNCLIHNVVCDGGDMFDCRSGAIKAINLTNSTIWNSCASRDFIRYDDKSSNFPGISPVIIVDHCTIDGVCGGSRRLLYVRFKDNSIVYTNNILSNTPTNERGFSDQGNTAVPTFKNNNYFNAPNFTSDVNGKAKFFDTEGTLLDPGYKDAANGDFTLSHEDLIYNQMGDPRWW